MRIVPLLAILVLCLMPAVAATWRAYGGAEPDTVADRVGGYMWQGPPGGAINRVYFNVAANEQIAGGGPSPNSAMLGNRIAAQPFEGFSAILGVWMDCNHDGYVGMVDGALLEYRDVVSAAAGRPIDLSICPLMEDTRFNQGRVHNGNGWITELIPIGPAEPHGTEPDARVLVDTDARVWGDNLALGASTPMVCGGPRGWPSPEAARHTGGMLAWLDCLEGGRAEGASSLWIGGPLDVDQPGPSDGQPVVSGVFDCSAEPLKLAPGVASPRPGVPRVDAHGSLAAAVREGYDEAPELGQCDPARSGADAYVLLGAVETLGADHVRTQPDVIFSYASQSRFDCETFGSAGCSMPSSLGAPEAMAPAAQVDGLVPPLDRRPAVGVGGWSAQPYAIPAARTGGLPHVDRGTTDAHAPVAAADVWTFYAFVSLPGVWLPGSVGTYGAEWCSAGFAHGAGVQDRWDCDPSDWWGVSVGTVYNLRDVDCYDGTLVAASADPLGKDVGPRSAGDALDAGSSCGGQGI